MIERISWCRFPTKVAVFIVTSLLSCMIAENASATVIGSYTFIDLYTLQPPAGGTFLQLPFDAPTVTATGLVVGVGRGSATANQDHALLWNGSVPTDLHPSGFTESFANGAAGDLQVGQAYSALTDQTHAILWNGSGIANDLNPTGFDSSRAYGLGGGEVVGVGQIVHLGEPHALLWTTSNTVVDLHPAGYSHSEALGTDGTQQVGWGYLGNVFDPRALLWNGTNQVIDLNPRGFTQSKAISTAGGQQVGYGSGPATGASGSSPIYHALLWNGSNSALDLNPTGFSDSYAFYTDGQVQLGFGTKYGGYPYMRALLWNGSNNAIDLGSFVPSNFSLCIAYSRDASGNIFGIAGDLSGKYHAVEWSVVPEPSGVSLLIVSALGLLRRCPSRRAGI